MSNMAETTNEKTSSEKRVRGKKLGHVRKISSDSTKQARNQIEEDNPVVPLVPNVPDLYPKKTVAILLFPFAYAKC